MTTGLIGTALLLASRHNSSNTTHDVGDGFILGVKEFTSELQLAMAIDGKLNLVTSPSICAKPRWHVDS